MHLIRLLGCLWHGHSFQGWRPAPEANPDFWRRCEHCGAVRFWIN